MMADTEKKVKAHHKKEWSSPIEFLMTCIGKHVAFLFLYPNNY